MAQNQYTDEVLDTVNWLKDHQEKEEFSFVFKTENVQLNHKCVTWKNYGKYPQDEEMRNLVRGAETALDAAEDMEWELDMDEICKQSVTTFDAIVKKCLFEVILNKHVDPKDCYWFIQHEHGKDTAYHCHVLLGGKTLVQAMGKWFRKQLNSMWSRYLVGLCEIVLTPAEQIKLREIIEDNQLVSLLTYTHKQKRIHQASNVWQYDCLLFS